MNLPILVLAIAFYAGVCWATLRHFRRVHAIPGALAALSIVWAGAFLAQIIALWPSRDLPPTAAIALPLLLIAITLWGWTVKSSRGAGLSLAFSLDLPTRLLECGPYRFVRHPFYTSYLLNWLALSLATLQWWVVAPSAAAVAIVVFAARSEEAKFANSDLADRYAAYQARTGMFFPRLRSTTA